MPSKHTFEENIVRLLCLCRQPKTLHYIKDTMPFNNERLKFYINKLVNDGLIEVSLRKIRVNKSKVIDMYDGRGTKNIITTTKGKELLKSKGIFY